MPISGVQSGYQLIQQSSKMAEEVALEVNQANGNSTSNELAFNRVEFDRQPEEKTTQAPPKDHNEALMKLSQASSYNRIGASVIERNNDVIGSLLDIQV
ncbi:hypothetical protein LO82_09655 [Vibrio vulnificus]|uniref:hypothetical protein n=1 Tax=Vibrio vulnificus TaxID=672 RepID=UPI0006AD22BC|nr:hypothetical protein [Vibrio vulnificus]KOR98162.1 hypothetical protein LO82_09655 [Vibrio vulnificus]HDY8063857.1 hypothetical protein [Vibrio vulnificus]